ncbi:LysE family transporter [Nonomuraea sp. NPDC049695]|uniref:LysE family transporter n=1 Tax=Nonomuraea sp. NPDC049695 TaxID=3154734 RepID=UPI0034260482
MALTARTSLKIGLFAALGVATADGLYALIATIGGSALSNGIELIMLPLQWASAVVLIGLAARTGATAISQYRTRQIATRADKAPLSPARAYLGLLGITMMNPITVIYFAALVLAGHSTMTSDHLGQAVFVLAAFVAFVRWQVVLAAGGALLGQALTGPRGRLITAMASSTLITVLAVHLLISTF